GRNVSFVMAPERPNELPEILERVARGERVEDYETERVRKDGTRLDVSISVSPIRDRSGAVVGAATIARDVTERKRGERAERMLATASRLFAESGLDRDAILDALCRAVVGTMAQTCLVHLVGAPGAPIEAAAVLDENPEHTAAARELLVEHRLSVGEG